MRSRKLASSFLPVALLPLATALCLLAAPRSAAALPLLTISGSARGLYGSVASDEEPTPYGAGLGLRLGVTLPISLYLGGSFDYFFGDSVTNALDTEVAAKLLQVMGRVGYDFGFGPATLRPQLGLGVASSTTEVGDLSTSESDFVLAPGLEFVFGLGVLSLGAEASYNKVFTTEVEGEEVEADAIVVGVGIGFSL